jgi:hypothetical protein
MTDLRYPVGKFQSPGILTPEARSALIDAIESTPVTLRKAVAGLSTQQLETPYRPGGWTVRQVVHHIPDSHLNAYVRTKLALTEDQPLIKPYQEAQWAELIDGRTASPEVSLSLLDALHTRWTILWRSLTPGDYARTLRHPEHPGILTIDWLLALYAWHGRHHVAHITSLRDREGWR